METFDTVPFFLIYAFRGCTAQGLALDPWSTFDPTQNIGDVTIPLILMVTAAVAMLLATATWWREMKTAIPAVLIAIGLISVIGFFGYYWVEVSNASDILDFFFGSGVFYLAVGEFSVYLCGVFVMILVSLILVMREVGWEVERNLIFLATGATVVMAIFFVFFARAVWACPIA